MRDWLFGAGLAGLGVVAGWLMNALRNAALRYEVVRLRSFVVVKELEIDRLTLECKDNLGHLVAHSKRISAALEALEAARIHLRDASAAEGRPEIPEETEGFKT